MIGCCTSREFIALYTTVRPPPPHAAVWALLHDHGLGNIVPGGDHWREGRGPSGG